MLPCRLGLVLRRPELFHEDLENEFRASIFGYFCYMTKVTKEFLAFKSNKEKNKLYNKNKTRNKKTKKSPPGENKKGGKQVPSFYFYCNGGILNCPNCPGLIRVVE